MDSIIKVENLGKKYIISHQAREKYFALRDVIAQKASRIRNKFLRPFVRKSIQDNPYREEFWALKHVSFEIKKGDRVGVIGRNGAGKTTLLKILSRITELTQGRVTLKGRVASLLEVGTGFHPELTGRENIFLNGAILGMSKSEISGKFDEIVAFAEVDKFLDTPVKRYSSGMYVRLAFAVAAHLEPEILLVDEVLAVGDAQFQKKCLGKMEDISTKEGRTILFVSHNMGAVSELCTRAILLKQGQIVNHGPVAEVIESYVKDLAKSESSFKPAQDASLPCSILEIKLSNSQGLETTLFDINDEIIITITYKLMVRLDGFRIVLILSRNMVDILHTYDVDSLDEIPARGPGVYQTQYKIPKMFLKAGRCSVTIITTTSVVEFQWLNSVLNFEIEEYSQNTYMKGYRKERLGIIISPGIWDTQKLK